MKSAGRTSTAVGVSLYLNAMRGLLESSRCMSEALP